MRGLLGGVNWSGEGLSGVRGRLGLVQSSRDSEPRLSQREGVRGRSLSGGGCGLALAGMAAHSARAPYLKIAAMVRQTTARLFG